MGLDVFLDGIGARSRGQNWDVKLGFWGGLGSVLALQ